MGNFYSIYYVTDPKSFQSNYEKLPLTQKNQKTIYPRRASYVCIWSECRYRHQRCMPVWVCAGARLRAT